MSMAKRNATNRALQRFMANRKKIDPQAELEWEIACNTNNKRGHVYDQHEMLELYTNRMDWENDKKAGATKICHTVAHNGNDFEYIVVKRFKNGGRIFDGTNQLISEIECWQAFADKDEADYLCPILKFFKSKSDKVSDTSKKMQHNVMIIAQKAVFVGCLEDACVEACRLNGEPEYNSVIRERELANFADAQGWWDVEYNGGNCGVIYDYSQRRYKAVIIDYAL